MTAASPAVADAAPPKGPVAGHPEINWTMLLLGFAGMVVGQFMAILDIQIVAASLPQIQAGVGASADEISWIQTAYLIPEVVMIPLSGFLSRLWGTQRLFLASCAGFVLMSIATGLSSSIEMMILFRALQGFVGGAMIPTVFAVAFTAFPPDKRVTASVVMGLIVTLAPTVGPTLGGHLTEWLSWRWLFFINVAPGLLVLFLVGRYANFDKGDPSLAKGFDWWGLFLMAAFVGLVDGLVRRDIRRFGAGRESGFIYHRARASLIPLAVLPWVTYLALPVSVNPLLILLPSAALLGVAVCIAAATFKKYL